MFNFKEPNGEYQLKSFSTAQGRFNAFPETHSDQPLLLATLIANKLSGELIAITWDEHMGVKTVKLRDDSYADGLSLALEYPSDKDRAAIEQLAAAAKALHLPVNMRSGSALVVGRNSIANADSAMGTYLNIGIGAAADKSVPKRPLPVSTRAEYETKIGTLLASEAAAGLTGKRITISALTQLGLS